MIPGYITNLSFAGTEYQVFAYTQDSNGARTYLPTNTPVDTLDKIRKLTSGLLSAHESRRQSLNEPLYEVKMINSQGLIKSDNSPISHDFQLIDPLTRDLATVMGPPATGSAVKAQNVWDAVEKAVRDELSRPVSAAQAPGSNPSPEAQPAPQTGPVSPPPSSSPSPVRASVQISATGLNLSEIDLTQSDWYEKIPPRAKLRILDETLHPRHPGPVYQKVWERFKETARIQREYDHLLEECNTLPSTIPNHLRDKATQTIEEFQKVEKLRRDRDLAELYNNLKAKISLEKKLQQAQKDFQIKAAALKEIFHREPVFKEQFSHQVRHIPEVERIIIADWDRQPSQSNNYYNEIKRFIQVLSHWIDTN